MEINVSWQFWHLFQRQSQQLYTLVPFLGNLVLTVKGKKQTTVYKGAWKLKCLFSKCALAISAHPHGQSLIMVVVYIREAGTHEWLVLCFCCIPWWSEIQTIRTGYCKMYIGLILKEHTILMKRCVNCYPKIRTLNVGPVFVQ